MKEITASIKTSTILLKIFKNKKDASYAHIFGSKLEKLPIDLFFNVENFNPERLKKTAIEAYPMHDRPRGYEDIQSVKFHSKQLLNKINISPIWIVLKNKKYILLDGAHRIVASYIENKKFIYAYVIKI
jgi:hypothetical protein